MITNVQRYIDAYIYKSTYALNVSNKYTENLFEILLWIIIYL